MVIAISYSFAVGSTRFDRGRSLTSLRIDVDLHLKVTRDLHVNLTRCSGRIMA